MSRRLLALSALLGVLLVAVVLLEHHEHRVASAMTSAQDPHVGTPARMAARGPTAPALGAELAPADGAAGALRLEGQVVDNRKRPVGGVTVTLGARAVTTEADGAFAFDGLVEGEYAVIAEKDGAYAESIDVRLDAESDPLELVLARGPSLRVHVVDEAHEPVAGARVRTSSREAKTDARGDALLRAVDYSSETFTVEAAAFAPARVSLETGDDPDVTFTREVVLAPGAQLAGVVVDEAGEPVADARVDLEEVGGEERGDRVSADEHGAFTFELIGRGTYRLTASSDELTTGPAVEVAIDGVTPARAIVHAVAGAEVAGVVVDTQGRAIAKANVHVGPRWVEAGDDGTFAVRGLEGGEVDISASTHTLGGRTQVTTLAAREHRRVRIVLESASISGIVVDPRGEPIVDATIYGRSEDPQGFGVAQSDEAGRFDLGGLPPGTYALTASREDSRHDGPAVITSTGDHRVRIVLPERATLTGKVVLDGAPVPYFGYELLAPEDHQPWNPTAVRDPSGTFTNDDAEPGRWSVAIVGPGFAPRIVSDVVVEGGRLTDLGAIHVEHGRRSVRGRVVDMRGAPVADAEVRVTNGYRSTSGGGLRALARGIFLTRTAADGSYHLEGMSGLDTDARVIATQDGVGSAEVELGDQEVVDLTLVTAP